MHKRWRKFGFKPMLVDGGLNVALALFYVLVTAFGFVSAIFDPYPGLVQVVGSAPLRIMASIIGVAGLVAATSCLRSLVSSKWERWEFYSTATWFMFMMAYTLGLLSLTISMGPPPRLTTVFVFFASLVLPGWKMLYILKRSRGNDSK